MVLKYLKYLRRACRIFCVVPEISDVGRLHCHGWFVISDKIKWHKQVLHKFTRNGRFKMNEMRCTKALCYYVKDIEITQGILNYPVPYTHDTLRMVVVCTEEIFSESKDKECKYQ